MLLGAGLLNKTITNIIDYPNDYENIVLITRDTENAKKYIASKKFPISIIDINKIDIKFLMQLYDVFIATDRIDYVYKKKIIDLCKNKNCLNVVDVSSSPILELRDLPAKYFSLYSKNTEKLIKNSNIEFSQKYTKLKMYLKYEMGNKKNK